MTTVPPPPAPDPRRVVVIGAGPGLGAAVARRFARQGSAVTLVARSADALEELAAQLRSTGADVAVAVADAADVEGFGAALREVARRTPPDVVVYNAALVAADQLLTSSPRYLLDALAVDAVGAVTAAQVFTPAMRSAGTGTLLVTGGGPGLVPDPEHASLTLGKSALRAAVTVLHDQLAPEGVHVASVTVVGVIAPGTDLDPDLLAERYWQLHTEPVGAWSTDVVVRGS
ncbi:SDR family NAD(P)-dependent oxidoreductase [Quadrisphaera setariae]|uniref:SDR family NAD(P)-dependent oxidoreductase n=1 Tax=Quadrisphaera setariae TaxID=2593304 RepID=A0A5C8ZH68_9ACTN|nr:SDR family NAD(P)-dependent oxidoreductase [Quadrisphaera setariae]TXR57167.1 SDR family NAD(P)-dependent oxidoreductase [Quadrisphaera setariae]